MLRRYCWNDPSTFLDALRGEVLRRASLTPSFFSHNVGGWRSEDDFFEWPLEQATQLRVRFAEIVGELPSTKDPHTYRYRAWAIVNRAGSFHRRHVHGGSIWSGVFYVDAGGHPSARTLFEIEGRVFHIDPESGLMTVFPSCTPHSVEPHLGGGERVTIAFDAY
jgi:hypothetical protein